MPEIDKNKEKYREPAKFSNWMCDSCIVVFPGRANEKKEKMHVGEYASSISPLSIDLGEGVTIPVQDGGMEHEEELDK